jgi:mono/diheme cytochrome c family protein
MKRLVIAVLGAVFLCAGSASAQDAKKVAEGKKVYDAKECAKCHMIAGKGNKIGPLDGVGTKLNEADMRKWLTDPVEMEKTLDHKPKVKMSSKIKQMNLQPADVDVLVAYLKTLTKK